MSFFKYSHQNSIYRGTSGCHPWPHIRILLELETNKQSSLPPFFLLPPIQVNQNLWRWGSGIIIFWKLPSCDSKARLKNHGPDQVYSLSTPTHYISQSFFQERPQLWWQSVGGAERPCRRLVYENIDSGHWSMRAVLTLGYFFVCF